MYIYIYIYVCVYILPKCLSVSCVHINAGCDRGSHEIASLAVVDPWAAGVGSPSSKYACVRARARAFVGNNIY